MCFILQEGRHPGSHEQFLLDRKHTRRLQCALHFEILKVFVIIQQPILALCRWKAVSLSDTTGGLFVFGGDPLDFNGIGRIYLNDLWHLYFKEDSVTPYWQQIRYEEGKYAMKQFH